jgi:hypothetical protein
VFRVGRLLYYFACSEFDAHMYMQLYGEIFFRIRSKYAYILREGHEVIKNCFSVKLR